MCNKQNCWNQVKIWPEMLIKVWLNICPNLTNSWWLSGMENLHKVASIQRHAIIHHSPNMQQFYKTILCNPYCKIPMLLPIVNASHYNVDIAHFCESNKWKIVCSLRKFKQ